MIRRAALAALVVALAACSSGSGDAPRADASPSASATVSPAPSSGPSVPDRPVTLAFAGDVHFDADIGRNLAADPGTVIGPMARTLEAADFAMVNLETAVTSGGRAEPKQFAFRAPPTAFQALAAAGVDAVSLANNHGLDYGRAGLADTLAAGERAGVAVVGAGSDADAAFAPHRLDVDGQRVAVFAATQVLDAFAETTWPAGEDRPGLAAVKADEGRYRLLDAVREAAAAGEVVVVFLHWGQQLNPCPLPRQEELAEELAEAGADAVVGTHAHQLLGAGWLGDTYVDYGLGNFLFYAGRPTTVQSGVLTLTVQDGQVRDPEWTPAILRDDRPQPVGGAEGEAVVRVKERLRAQCTDLAARRS